MTNYSFEFRKFDRKRSGQKHRLDLTRNSCCSQDRGMHYLIVSGFRIYGRINWQTVAKAKRLQTTIGLKIIKLKSYGEPSLLLAE